VCGWTSAGRATAGVLGLTGHYCHVTRAGPTSGSLSIDLTKGTFFDHERTQGGGVLDLINRELGGRHADAVTWLQREGLLPTEGDASGGFRQRREVAVYDYTDDRGDLRLQVVRYDPKAFRQRQPDGKGGYEWNAKGVPLLPYRLPELIEAVAAERPVFILEGEKDVDAARAIGVPATCNAGGAGKWRREHARYLRNAEVVIVPDNDPAGADGSGARCSRYEIQFMAQQLSAHSGLRCGQVIVA
jgi:putative DNA primase/helicase